MRVPIFIATLASTTPFLYAQDLDSLCLPPSVGRFWGVKGWAGDVYEYTISGGVVEIGPMLLDGPAAMFDIAFCSASGPATFYGHGDSYGFRYYQDEVWVNVDLDIVTRNIGGPGTHLYFLDQSVRQKLYHVDGTNYSMIADPSPGMFTGDVVVNHEGNALIGYSPATTSMPVTEYRMYSPLGDLLETYAVNYSWNNNYGTFMLDDVVYLGFGEFNPDYPNSLVPMTFNGTNATLGTPIPFIAEGETDLASCVGGYVGLSETAIDPDRLTCYPNPTADKVIVVLPSALHARPIKMQFNDAAGSTIDVAHVMRSSELHIDLGALSKGSYQLVLADPDGRLYSARVVRE